MLKTRVRTELLKENVPTLEKIKSVLTDLNPDGSFRSVNYKDDNRSGWKTDAHLGNCIVLARAWATPELPYYQDPQMADAVKKSVGYWCVNKFRNSNWWWNDMQVPQQMGRILLLADPLFPDGPEREAALDICHQAVFMPRYTGDNRVFIAGNIFYRALLERNERALVAAVSAISEEVRMAPTDNKKAWALGGIREDGCYHQHGPQIQFGNYGMGFFKRIAYWSNILKGTRWELSPEQWKIMHHLAFDGYRWVLWKGELNLLACGRQLWENAASTKGKSILASLEMLRDADPGDKEIYNTVIESNQSGQNALVGTRHFWNSDYTVHRRPEWYSAVRMNSTRVRPIEDDTNWDNALGRYFSDGICLVERTGNEYRNITACWDWTRLPGSTLPKTPIYTPEQSKAVKLTSGGNTPRWTLSKKWRQLGTTDFTGTVTDGKYAVSIYTQDIDEVKAKKAYFFDENSVRQLVCGIDSTSPYPVATTVNCCILNDQVQSGEDWYWHDGIGYRGKNLKLITGERKGDWRYLHGALTEPTPDTKNLFSLVIEHGDAPKGLSCEYTILPGATPEQTATWQGSKTRSNTPELQAVELSDGRIGAVFHVPGKLGSFQTNSPGVFLIGNKEVWVADPTALLKQMKLSLNGTTKTVQLPTGESAGKSIKVEF